MRTLHTKSQSSHPPRVAQRTLFLREFIRNPSATAAISPSSRALAVRMIEDIDLLSCKSIVEFGPGSGPFTRAILDRLPDGWLTTEGGHGRFIAIEFNPRMAEIISRDFPRATVVTDSAANIEKICAEHTIAPATLDVIVSGLGFAALPSALTTSILEGASRALKPGGHFRTFTYHVSLIKRQAWHLRSEMNRLFSHVECSRAVWANFPSAFVYRCVK